MTTIRPKFIVLAASTCTKLNNFGELRGERQLVQFGNGFEMMLHLYICLFPKQCGNTWGSDGKCKKPGWLDRGGARAIDVRIFVVSCLHVFVCEFS